MSGGWHFYRFDFARYLQLRPALRSASTPEAFAAIADAPETQSLAALLESEEISREEARHAWLRAVCCLGDALLLDTGFPRFVAALGRRRGAEDAAQILCDLAAGGKNIEAWLLPSYGLVGLLTPDETAALAAHCRPLRGKMGMRVGKRRRRRGGLLGALSAFFRSLFDRSPRTEEMMPLLLELIDNAAERGEGIAVFLA